MFAKILIANRGEIACRIIKTARRLRIATVAVYSDVDRDALHVELADEAIAIGPAPAAQSYLDPEKILAACRASGAEAVHPGYGFLSENADFAARLAGEGIAFIGPQARAIAAMGDKIASKRLAAEAGVATVPGHLGVVADEDEAAAVSREIGYPIIIKASAGGGGKGMRVAQDEAAVRERFRLASSEAAAAFGDGRLFIEKFIIEPRHIEFQVVGDKHGTVIHLGERECSIQRRNQKIIEEAPSPFLDQTMRARMGEQAVALSRAVAYDSAGTVEFVVGQDKSFYFLEMNTRLQVEHPVTELVTGIDLVEQMIRVAAGEPLGFRQEDVRIVGWAVESRIYAEDPFRDFLPSVGRLVTYRPPAERHDPRGSVRNDSGVVEGSEIPLHYDPMIAKLCTHAPTRIAAINAMADALDAFAIEGIRHNIPFLAMVMQRPRWRDGRLSTAFLAEEFPGGVSPPRAEGELRQRLIGVAAAIDHVEVMRRGQISGAIRLAGARQGSRRVAVLGEERQALEVDDAAGEIQVTILSADGAPERLHTLRSAWRPGDPVWHGMVDGKGLSMLVKPILNGVELLHRGVRAQIRLLSPREAELARWLPRKSGSEMLSRLLCPMPGLVRSIEVGEGQAVKPGDALCVVEAMKMENVLRAERDGTVAAIRVRPGDILAVDAVIMEFV